MRTIEEIKKQMTDAVLSDPALRQAFGLERDEEWDAQVSSVSLLNLLIYIVAVAALTLEWLHDRFRAEVEERIAAAFPGTIGWYWNKVMQFQYGDTPNEYGAYDADHPDRRIVTHCAVFEVDNGITVKVNKGADFQQLTASELQALQAYVAAIKFAGTTASVVSYPPDRLSVELDIWRDPMVLDAEMRRIADGSPVVADAIKAYLDSIAYGGVFNKTRLIDAVQSVPGVADVTIADGSIYCEADQSDHSFGSFNQNFRSYGGHFTIDETILNDMP